MNIEQERKYDAVDGKIVNRSTGKPIPDLDIAKKAAEAQRNDTRTDDEKIADGVAFILDTRIGGT